MCKLEDLSSFLRIKTKNVGVVAVIPALGRWRHIKIDRSLGLAGLSAKVISEFPARERHCLKKQGGSAF